MKRLAAVALLVLLISCTSPADGPQNKIWTCGMHPEVAAAEPGVCPICNMDLVRAKDPPEDKPQTNGSKQSGEESSDEAGANVSIRTPPEGASVRELLAVLSTQGQQWGHKQIIPSKLVGGVIDLHLQDLTWREALDAVQAAADLVAVEDEKFIRVYTAEEARKMNLPNTVNPWAQGEAIHGTLKDDALRKATPDNGVITSKEQLQALLKTWQADETTWTTNFAKNFVFVQTVDGPNRVMLDYRFEKDSRNLMVMVGSTRMAGPGFGWTMQAVRKDAIEKVNGLDVEFAKPTVLISAGDAGKTRQAQVGELIAIDLKGNPTTGYAWVLDGIDGRAIRQVGSVKFVKPQAEADQKRRLGAGGVFHATFQAVEAGTATVSLAYRRPWEKDKEPARTFSVTIDVKPAKKEQAAARAVTVTVRMADGTPQYTLLGKHPGQLTDLLEALKAARENGATDVLLDLAADVPQKHVADVINVAKAAGFASVGMKASEPADHDDRESGQLHDPAKITPETAAKALRIQVMTTGGKALYVVNDARTDDPGELQNLLRRCRKMSPDTPVVIEPKNDVAWTCVAEAFNAAAAAKFDTIGFVRSD
ncbi:MAG: hypothetical protein GVY16_02035 [Planctomycetes bacterium]|jgi:inhibitor of cysteine peptidase|nr:protease inhibitor I42 family protein [Phycisphaerae bacterium]NBB94501.1 hypothetical protein [Planctomycetota bacterium]